jgi:hypothetical protein
VATATQTQILTRSWSYYGTPTAIPGEYKNNIHHPDAFTYLLFYFIFFFKKKGVKTNSENNTGAIVGGVVGGVGGAALIGMTILYNIIYLE